MCRCVVSSSQSRYDVNLETVVFCRRDALNLSFLSAELKKIDQKHLRGAFKPKTKDRTRLCTPFLGKGKGFIPFFKKIKETGHYESNLVMSDLRP